MSQKDYRLSIVLALSRQESYTRALARQLNTNQTTVARKIRELMTENIVDASTVGKNKIVFLKKSLEARQMLCAAELFKLSAFVAEYPLLRSVVEQIQNESEISMAIVFGSYAKGLAMPSSDIDVYIDTAKQKIKERIEKFDSKLSIKIGKYNRNSILVREIEKNHVIIKGVEKFYEFSKLSL